MPGESEELRILDYEVRPAAVLPWDPRSIDVATELVVWLQRAAPDATIELIGSTAVPGCAGKGVIDLMLIYPAGGLEDAASTVDRLGFQRWEAPGAHPPSRPVRIGAIEYDGTIFRIHLHLLAPGTAEIARQRRFRDRLRSDPRLVADYVAKKQEIIERGITWGPSFGDAKSDFIRQACGDS